MKKLITICTGVFALLAISVARAKPPQKPANAGLAPSGAMSKPNRLMPDQTETPRTKAWCDKHYGLFIHFNINTFIGENGEKADKVEKAKRGEKREPWYQTIPAKLYAPSALDVDGWIRIAKDAGMKYALLTTKHRHGFCLWDSKVLWQGKEFH